MSLSSDYQNVVALFGVPRSGTSWVGQIFNSSPLVDYRYQPLFSYEFKDRLTQTSTSDDIEQFYTDLKNATSDFVLQKQSVGGTKNKEFKKGEATTLVWKEVRHIHLVRNLLERSNTKCVLIIRHPCAVINSWIQAPKEFDGSWEILEEWRFAQKKNEDKTENYYGYEKWKEVMELFLRVAKDFPDKVYLLQYEELVLHPFEQAKRLFEFAGVSFDEQTKDFLTLSTTSDDNDPYGVMRRGPDPYRWRNELTPTVADQILSDFEASGLKERLGYK